MVPAERMTGAVAVPADARPEALDLGDQLFSVQALQVIVHRQTCSKRTRAARVNSRFFVRKIRSLPRNSGKSSILLNLHGVTFIV